MTSKAKRPNIILIMADDLGYSDLGCYGGEQFTPHLDALAGTGVLFTQFHNTARCSPSRASLLTGLHPHQTGIGVLTGDQRPVGYRGDLHDGCATVAELLSAQGYATGLTGKWHLSADVWNPSPSWPTRRGFDYFYGTLTGCGSYFDPGTLVRGEENVEHEAMEPSFYYTDAITEEAVGFVDRSSRSEQPFFLYVAYTAPHWPLHAPTDRIATMAGRFDAGWDQLRRNRFRRQQEFGIVAPGAELSPRDPEEPAWIEVGNPDWEASRMEAYAAQVAVMDEGVGRIVDSLRTAGCLEDTVIVFLSDNGASAEELPQGGDPASFSGRTDIFRQTTRDGEPVRLGNHRGVRPGAEDTYASYGRAWANLSNTPFRRYKRWTHEGGIAAPLVVSWPAGGLGAGSVVDQPLQLTHILPTLLDLADIEYPPELNGRSLPPLEGRTARPYLQPTDSSQTESVPELLFWEHCGNAAVRQGRWKLVRVHDNPWELYDLDADPTELADILDHHRDVAAALFTEWSAWADRVGVLPFGRIEDWYRIRARPAESAAG